MRQQSEIIVFSELAVKCRRARRDRRAGYAGRNDLMAAS